MKRVGFGKESLRKGREENARVGVAWKSIPNKYCTSKRRPQAVIIHRARGFDATDRLWLMQPTIYQPVNR
jgi:hypothetical protein